LLQIRLAVVRLAVVLAVLSTARYFWWRLFHTMNPVAKVFFWVFLVAEVLNFIEACMFYFIAWKPTRYATPQPLQGRTVDIYIATYNEPVELLRETIVCALNVTYPHKTYVLDDGCRGSVEALAQELGANYIARKERDDAKAGNLNNALRLTQGEFVITLDADHVPQHETHDPLRLLVIGERRIGRAPAVAPHLRQPFGRLNRLGPTDDRRQKTVEHLQIHAVLRHAVGGEKAFERVELGIGQGFV